MNCRLYNKIQIKENLYLKIALKYVSQLGSPYVKLCIKCYGMWINLILTA